MLHEGEKKVFEALLTYWTLYMLIQQVLSIQVREIGFLYCIVVMQKATFYNTSKNHYLNQTCIILEQVFSSCSFGPATHSTWPNFKVNPKNCPTTLADNIPYLLCRVPFSFFIHENVMGCSLAYNCLNVNLKEEHVTHASNENFQNSQSHGLMAFVKTCIHISSFAIFILVI